MPERKGLNCRFLYLFRNAHKFHGQTSGSESITPADIKPQSESPGANLHDLGILEDELCQMIKDILLYR